MIGEILLQGQVVSPRAAIIELTPAHQNHPVIEDTKIGIREVREEAEHRKQVPRQTCHNLPDFLCTLPPSVFNPNSNQKLIMRSMVRIYTARLTQET